MNKTINKETILKIRWKAKSMWTKLVNKGPDATIRKFQMNKETFNRNIEGSHELIMDTSNEIKYFSSWIADLGLCILLIQVFYFLEKIKKCLINLNTFARIKIIHSSIFTPFDLIESLKCVSQLVQKTHFPVTVYSASIAEFVYILSVFDHMFRYQHYLSGSIIYNVYK